MRPLGIMSCNKITNQIKEGLHSFSHHRWWMVNRNSLMFNEMRRKSDHIEVYHNERMGCGKNENATLSCTFLNLMWSQCWTFLNKLNLFMMSRLSMFELGKYTNTNQLQLYSWPWKSVLSVEGAFSNETMSMHHLELLQPIRLLLCIILHLVRWPSVCTKILTTLFYATLHCS